MGITSLPNYWWSELHLHNYFDANLMPVRRFIWLLDNFHINSNSSKFYINSIHFYLTRRKIRKKTNPNKKKYLEHILLIQLNSICIVIVWNTNVLICFWYPNQKSLKIIVRNLLLKIKTLFWNNYSFSHLQRQRFFTLSWEIKFFFLNTKILECEVDAALAKFPKLSLLKKLHFSCRKSVIAFC